jgi:tetratricopeptide (TPR) repeat protein
MFDGEGMIMSLFQRIKSMLGLSEATVPPPASKPTPTPMAPKAVAPAVLKAVEPAPAPTPVAAAPVSPEVKALLAKGRAHLKEEDIAAAKESFDAVLAIDPENEAALKLSGLSAARLKKAADQAKKAAAAAVKG